MLGPGVWASIGRTLAGLCSGSVSEGRRGGGASGERGRAAILHRRHRSEQSGFKRLLVPVPITPSARDLAL